MKLKSSLTNICFFIIFIVNIKFSVSVDYFQAIWHEKYETASGDPIINKYHIFNTITKQTDFLENFLPSTTYKVLKKRSNKFSFETVLLLHNKNELNRKYSFFMPEINGNHELNMKFVIWDITCSTGVLNYKIKYFNCDAEMNLFYTTLGNEIDKAFNDGTSGLIPANARLKDTLPVYVSTTEMIDFILKDNCV